MNYISPFYCNNQITFFLLTLYLTSCILCTIWANFNLPRSHLYKCFQIRSFVYEQSSTFPASLSDSKLDKTLIHLQGLISKIVNSISWSNNEPLNKIKADLERDMDVEIPTDIWNRALTGANGTTSCASLNLIQFKVFHHVQNARTKTVPV